MIRVNFGRLFEDSCIIAPDDVSLVDAENDKAVTYEELQDQVCQAGNSLRQLGVDRGDRVALMFPNDLKYISLFFGAARLGAVAVPVNIQLSVETLAYILNNSGADTVVSSADPTVLETARKAVNRSDIHQLTVTTDSPEVALDGVVEAEVKSFTKINRTASSNLVPANVDPDDPLFQPYTSGSTGKPKGVVLTHGGVGWNTRTIRKVHHFDRDERGLLATPLYHKNAMVGAVKPILDAGGQVVILDGFNAERVLETVERYEVNYMTGVPAMYEMLLDSPALNNCDTSSLNWCVCGSDTVPESLLTRFEDVFEADMLESYGLTEGGPVVTASPRWGPRKPGSAGLALPGVETRIVDPDDGTELGAGETGELLVANPGVGTYHERPDAVTEAFEKREGKEFLHTHDLAYIDEQGYHYIIGRLDNMLTVGGENVYPTQVEDLISRLSSVEKVTVVGVPHAIKGEAPVAFVVGEGITEEEIKQFTLEKGPAYAHPRRVLFIENFPLTGAEKIDRNALEAQAKEIVDCPL